MDGKSKDVKALIKLRQSRPSFARMISWEFSKASDDGDTKRIKQRVKVCLFVFFLLLSNQENQRPS